MNEAASPVAYLDANAFIDAIEGEESISLPIKRLLEASRTRRGTLITSELTLAEVLGPKNYQRRPDVERLYLDLLVWSRFIDLRPVSRETLYETVELRRFARLKLPDAIHLATAILANCQFFVSRDGDFTQMPKWMKKVTPDAAGIVQVIEAIEQS